MASIDKCPGDIINLISNYLNGFDIYSLYKSGSKDLNLILESNIKSFYLEIEPCEDIQSPNIINKFKNLEILSLKNFNGNKYNPLWNTFICKTVAVSNIKMNQCTRKR